MTSYLALLRGINVGGNKKVPMAELKKLFAKLGYSDVSTYINSGNVLFSSSRKDISAMTKEIEAALEKTFGFEVRTVLRTKENIDVVCKAIPKKYTNDDTQKTDVLFLWDDYDSKATIQKIKTTPVDTLTYVSGAIIWHLDRKNYTKSGMHDFIGTPVYKNMTARNVNTVRTLSELLQKS